MDEEEDAEVQAKAKAAFKKEVLVFEVAVECARSKPISNVCLSVVHTCSYYARSSCSNMLVLEAESLLSQYEISKPQRRRPQAASAL